MRHYSFRPTNCYYPPSCQCHQDWFHRSDWDPSTGQSANVALPTAPTAAHLTLCGEFDLASSKSDASDPDASVPEEWKEIPFSILPFSETKPWLYEHEECSGGT